MQVKEMLDDIEQQLSYRGLAIPDRFIMLSWMSNELNEITGRYQFDWSFVHVDPVIKTVEGQRAYMLPADFPDNFVVGASEGRGDQYCCKIDDASTESLLTYQSPVQFFSKSLRSSSDSKPSHYTIMSLPNGRKEIQLDPPPDDNSDSNYTVDGLYQKADWKLEEMDALPPLPGNSAVLRYAVLRRCDAAFQARYEEALAILALRAAQHRKTRLVMTMGENSQTNSFALMR